MCKNGRVGVWGYRWVYTDKRVHVEVSERLSRALTLTKKCNEMDPNQETNGCTPTHVVGEHEKDVWPGE